MRVCVGAGTEMAGAAVRQRRVAFCPRHLCHGLWTRSVCSSGHLRIDKLTCMVVLSCHGRTGRCRRSLRCASHVYRRRRPRVRVLPTCTLLTSVAQYKLLYVIISDSSRRQLADERCCCPHYFADGASLPTKTHADGVCRKCASAHARAMRTFQPVLQWGCPR
jgi:hypothetical protein